MKKLSILIAFIIVLSLNPIQLFTQEQTKVQAASKKQSVIEKKTSRLGYIRTSEAKVYPNLKLKTSKTAGEKLTNQVYYIKRQATVKGKTYYLVSKQRSAEKGVIGWVNAKDLTTRKHTAVDKKKKTFYLKGTGKAYKKVWGRQKDQTYSSLKSYKNRAFKVQLTEKAGNKIWYRGTLNGKTVWISSDNVGKAKTGTTSRLGRIKNTKVRIYTSLGSSSSKAAGTTYTNTVYYIKKKSVINGEAYFLISRQRSDKKGVVGWVNAKDLSTKSHASLGKAKKKVYIKGTGSAYRKVWGGKKDLVYPELKEYADQGFNVNLTEKVGSDVWYRGTLKGKTVWIQAGHVKETNTKYTKYDITLNEAVDIQLKRSPQTDKYRDKNAFVHKNYINIVKTGTVKADKTALRTSPKVVKNNIEATVKSKTKLTILGTKTEGSNKWYKVKYKNKELYVQTSLISLNPAAATTTSNVNIRESANSTSHVYATLPKGTKVTLVKEGKTWHEIKYGTWRNAKRADVKQYVDPTKNSRYQHLVLSSSVGVSSSELNKVLSGKGTLNGLGKAFIDGGKKHKVNEIYLISHAFLETGNGTSKLASGIEVGKDKKGKAVLVTSTNRKNLKDIKKVYNMFGIRAFDSCPNECGAIHAYEQGWTSPSKAVVGGAEFIGKQYIHNEYKQNTIYKMRWNFIYPPKQYATDVGWAVKQTARIEALYKQLADPNLEFDIPKFK